MPTRNGYARPKVRYSVVRRSIPIRHKFGSWAGERSDGRTERRRREIIQVRQIRDDIADRRRRDLRHGLGRGKANRRTDAFGARRRGLFLRSQGRGDHHAQGDHPFRSARDGSGTRRLGSRELGPSPPADRHRAAAFGQAHSQRLQSPPLRHRPDRGRGHAQTGTAHPAAAAGRQGSHPAQSAGHVAAHSRGGGGGGNGGDRGRHADAQAQARADPHRAETGRRGRAAQLSVLSLLLSAIATAIRDTAIDVSARPDDRSTAFAVAGWLV